MVTLVLDFLKPLLSNSPYWKWHTPHTLLLGQRQLEGDLIPVWLDFKHIYVPHRNMGTWEIITFLKGLFFC